MPKKIKTLYRKLANGMNRAICFVRGHDYPGLLFYVNALHFCSRCGKEVTDRKFSDLLPMTDEEREMFDRLQQD
jgi:hypothetical protein